MMRLTIQLLSDSVDFHPETRFWTNFGVFDMQLHFCVWAILVITPMCLVVKLRSYLVSYDMICAVGHSGVSGASLPIFAWHPYDLVKD